jgi:hypothetical protein
MNSDRARALLGDTDVAVIWDGEVKLESSSVFCSEEGAQVEAGPCAWAWVVFEREQGRAAGE